MMQCRRAFSLLEVLLAIAVVMILAGTVYAFLFDLLESRDRILDESDRSRAGIGVIEQLERDIMTTLAGASGYGAGVQGTRTSLTLLSRSVTLPIENESQTVLGDLQGVSFTWDGQSGALSASRWDVLSGERAQPEVISDKIAYMQLRYFDGSSWSGQYNSSSTLPVALEIAIWFGEPTFANEPWPDENDFEDRPEEIFIDSTDEAMTDDEFVEEPLPPERAPDRVRVVVVPDGPSIGWGGGP